MINKPMPRVKFSPECELRVFRSSDVICLDSDSDHTIGTDVEDDDSDDSSIQPQAPPMTIQHYRLGDTLRSTKDMEQFTAFGDTIQSIYALQLSEFAWVKRNSGDWTFCQLIERAENDRGEEVMTFSVSEMGHRKSLRPYRWINMVRKCSPHVRSEYFRSVMISL